MYLSEYSQILGIVSTLWSYILALVYYIHLYIYITHFHLPLTCIKAFMKPMWLLYNDSSEYFIETDPDGSSNHSVS
jgi:hypothetical protein